MAIEELFQNNYLVLYLISIILLLINKEIKINQKMVIIYLFTYLIKVYNILDLKILIIVLPIGLFIYFEYLIDDDMKQRGMENFWYKVLDYLYQIIFVHNILIYMVSLILVSHFIIDNTMQFTKLFYIASIILLIKTLTITYSYNYRINSFQNIYSEMYKILKYKKKNSKKQKKFYELLTIFEDKSFFIRKNDYNILCYDFIKYKYGIGKFTLDSGLEKFKHYARLLQIDAKKFVKNRLRGYSTIEMQVIRTLGLQQGSYKHTFRRKIYEFVYSYIFFKSLKKYLKKSNLSTDNFKENIAYVYFNIAPVYFNNIRYSTIIKMWGKDSLEKCTIEEVYIGVLCLSNKLQNKNNLYYYKGIIDKYNINIQLLKEKYNI